jgi:(E)-4-hydroxy-3-methylbut-2-enyl-diphosphate synthase
LHTRIQSKETTNVSERSRYRTRVVRIGDVPLGGDYPIRIQSMTTTDTMDTKATVEQSIRIIEAGSDYVRITAPSMKEAVNLENIKTELRTRGYKTPLIADIHFTPNAAEHAARIVEKVRVNPGNYADRKRFKVFQYTDEMYNSELERIRERFIPLVKVCKEYGTAMRIGTNHGSLSDRIMNRYGDTPLGMVESALEFVRICEDLNYHEIVLSMKASNPRVMIEAYRLLIKKMEEERMNYPLHLGVTEAGDGIDGRIKSAVGIGTLLQEGIGDTIRVSLTEEPEAEIPPCITLVNRTKRLAWRTVGDDLRVVPNFERRTSNAVGNIGGHHVPVVIMTLIDSSEMEEIGYKYISELDKWNIADAAADFVYVDKADLDFQIPGSLKRISDNGSRNLVSDGINFVKLKLSEVTDEKLKAINQNSVIVLDITNNPVNGIEALKIFANSAVPVIIYKEYENLTEEELMLYAGTDIGSLLIDGFGDGVWIDSSEHSLKTINSISFTILQATRTRISKTEYIACPSCGRTQFDLQETTSMIRSKTSHLKGIKIAIMGCIVNGPGEMADADYGFVGSGPGWVTLYRGKDVIERGIPYENALDKLIDLMKEDGNWISTSNV